MGRIKDKKFDTKLGRLAITDIAEYGIASEFFPEYSDDDIFILLKTPEETKNKHGDRVYIIIHNFIPEDYNKYDQDKWSYGGTISEGHYTVEIIDEDLSKSDYLNEYVTEIDLIYELQYLHQAEYTIIDTKDEL
jgi:hypothetical protein